MNVLYLDHPEADYLAAILYDGLAQLLGDAHVVVWPDKGSYHGKTDRYPSWYHSGQPQEEGTTAPFPWFPFHLPIGPAPSFEEVASLLRGHRFDAVIVASPRGQPLASFAQLANAVPRSEWPPVALVDGEDYADLRFDLMSQVRPDVTFKRELVASWRAQAGARFAVEPFPFASCLPERAPVDKDLDVVFLGGGTWTIRAEVCNHLRAALGSRFFGGAGVTLTHPEYLATLARAKVGICLRGHGYDTLRFWEIASSAGTLLVSDKLPIEKPHPFVHGETIVEFESLDECLEAVRCALEDEPWRARVATAGNAHLFAHHTSVARARQLLHRLGLMAEIGPPMA